MDAADILKAKGCAVVTALPDTTISEILGTMKDEGIGVVVISTDGAEVRGILSERDVVRNLVGEGAALLSAAAETVMVRDVYTCEPSAEIGELMKVMTDQRIRHIPIVQNGRLCGLISIGDVVKARLNELEGTWFHNVAVTHLLDGRIENAIEWAQKSVRSNPDWLPPRVMLAAALAHTNQMEAASDALSAVLHIAPTLTIESFRTSIAKAKPEIRKSLLDGLRRAGLPES